MLTPMNKHDGVMLHYGRVITVTRKYGKVHLTVMDNPGYNCGQWADLTWVALERPEVDDSPDEGATEAAHAGA